MARRALSASCLTLVQAVRPALDAAGSAMVRLGVSGGADSLALAAAVAHCVAADPSARVEALVVDHGLAEGSDAVAARAATQVRALGLPASVVAVEVGRGGGLEAAAREARHDALWAHPSASELPVGEVWLAHTLDDQAEGVLLGLLRGSGTRSLAAMAPRRPHRTPTGTGALVRPLLGVRRADTRQACADWGLEPWDDPANTDPAFRRSALRGVLPGLMRAVGVDATPNLARTAELARADADLLDELAVAASARAGVGGRLDVVALGAEPPALRTRVVHAWLRARGCPEVGQQHVAEVLRLVDAWHGQGPLHLPGGVRVSRVAGELRAEPA